MDRIRIGVIGLGFGKYIVEQLATGPGSQHFELAAVCDANVELVDQVAEEKGVKAYTSIDDLLADDSIRAIGLFTGPIGRANLIDKITKAGRDIMTTKPLELDADAAVRVLKDARAMGRVVHLNSPSPVMPAELRQVVAWQNELGLGRPVGCRRDVWVRYHEKATGTWYDDPALCPVAPIFRLGIYLINDLVRLFGPADTVTVLQSRIFTERPTADNSQLGILFKNGAIANIYASFCVLDGDHYRNAFVMNFENGTIYGNAGPHRDETVVFDLSVVQRVNDRRQIVATAKVDTGSGAYEWETFARAIRGETIDGEISPDDMAAGIRIIRAMRDAEKNGGVARVEP